MKTKTSLYPVVISLLLFMLLLIPGCRSGNNSVNETVSEKVDEIKLSIKKEGWKVVDGEDVFYLKVQGRASDRAEEKNDSIMKKTTCVESTSLQAKDQILRKILGEYIQSREVTIEGDTQSYIIESMSSGFIRGVEKKECASLKDRWLNCECVYSIKGPELKKKFMLHIEKAQEDIYNQ